MPELKYFIEMIMTFPSMNEGKKLFPEKILKSGYIS